MHADAVQGVDSTLLIFVDGGLFARRELSADSLILICSKSMLLADSIFASVELGLFGKHNCPYYFQREPDVLQEAHFKADALARLNCFLD